MKTAKQRLLQRVEEIQELPYASLIPAIVSVMEEYKDECLLYCGPADWDGVAAAKINNLKLALQDAKDQHKEACYVIGKMSIENTNLKEENNRLAVVVSAQKKEIEELEEDSDNPCGYEDEISKLVQRKDKLEEWLTDYRDGLKKHNVYHIHQGTINAINELLNEND